jgi:hypothetical protein
VHVQKVKQTALVPGGLRTNFLAAKSATTPRASNDGLTFDEQDAAAWIAQPKEAHAPTVDAAPVQTPTATPLALNALLDDIAADREVIASTAPIPALIDTIPTTASTESIVASLPTQEAPVLTLDQILPTEFAPSTEPALPPLVDTPPAPAYLAPAPTLKTHADTGLSRLREVWVSRSPKRRRGVWGNTTRRFSGEAPKTPQTRKAYDGAFKGAAILAALSLAVLLPIHAMRTLTQIGEAQVALAQSEQTGARAATRAAAALADRQFAQADEAMARAEQSFADASEALTQAEQELLGFSMLVPSVGRKVKSAKAILAAGQSCAEAAQMLTAGFKAIEERTSGGPATALLTFDRFVTRALPHLQAASTAMSEVDTSVLPVEKREAFLTLKAHVQSTAQALTQFHASAPALEAFLGLRTQERYLFLFQNTTELRPTGGFWGSLAEADLLDGNIVHTAIPSGGTYAMQGQLTSSVQAPHPLQALRARFELQDANWFPHFPAAAKKALWFYEKGGGPTADGVIAINSSFAAKLIDTIGPLTLSSGTTIDGENFLFETQRQVERDYDKEANTPKAFIGELVGALLERMSTLKSDELVKVASLLAHALATREIQLYHRDPAIQATLSAQGWTGELRQVSGDYLMVNHANIGGGKTDGLIEEHVTVNSAAQADGSLKNTVTITRKNHSIASALFSGKNNVDFVRLFVPHGSTLVSLEGNEPPPDTAFEATDGLAPDEDTLAQEQGTYGADHTLVGSAFGKTVLGAWTQTKPGEVSTLVISYQTPAGTIASPNLSWVRRLKEALGIPTASTHTFFWQAQSGSEYRSLHYQFHPGTWQPRYTTEENALTLEARERDAYFGSLLLAP